MDKKIFIINGSGGVGKDTFCNFVSLSAQTFIVSSIDPAKDIAYQLGWSGNKEEKDRKFLADLKDLMTRYNDYPMQYLQKEVDVFRNYSKAEVMFIHIREPEEIDKAVKAFDAKTILITAYGRVKPILSNHADRDVYKYPYNYYLDNSGTLQDLMVAVTEFCKFYDIGH